MNERMDLKKKKKEHIPLAPCEAVRAKYSTFRKTLIFTHI